MIKTYPTLIFRPFSEAALSTATIFPTNSLRVSKKIAYLDSIDTAQLQREASNVHHAESVHESHGFLSVMSALDLERLSCSGVFK